MFAMGQICVCTGCSPFNNTNCQVWLVYFAKPHSYHVALWECATTWALNDVSSIRTSNIFFASLHLENNVQMLRKMLKYHIECTEIKCLSFSSLAEVWELW